MWVHVAKVARSIIRGEILNSSAPFNRQQLRRILPKVSAHTTTKHKVLVTTITATPVKKHKNPILHTQSLKEKSQRQHIFLINGKSTTTTQGKEDYNLMVLV